MNNNNNNNENKTIIRTYNDKNLNYWGIFTERANYSHSYQEWTGDFSNSKSFRESVDRRLIPHGKESGVWKVTQEKGNINDPNFGKYWNNLAPKKDYNDNEVAMHQRSLQEFQEKKHQLEIRLVEERTNPQSCCEKHRQERIASGKVQEFIRDLERDIKNIEFKIQYEKDWLVKNVNDSQPKECWEICRCGNKFDKANYYCRVPHIDGSCLEVFCSADCAEKYKTNPHGKVEHRHNKLEKNDNNDSDLQKENSELKQQLTEVQQQLDQISKQLKELEKSLTDKDKNELAKKWIEIQEQTAKEPEKIGVIKEKTTALANAVNAQQVNTQNASSPNKAPENNTNLLIGGGIVLTILTLGGVGYCLVRSKKNKKRK